MTDKWQAGKTYAPGSLVVPASQPAVDATSAENGDFAAGNSGWDYTGSCTFSSTGGYSNANCCIAPGVTAGGLALNKAKFLMSPGETISANCMIQQGASDVDHTRGYVQVYFYDATDTQIGDPVSGNIVNDGRGGAWHQSSLATPAAAPAGTAYARCGIYLYQNSADPIWGDNLVVYYARRKPAAGLIFKATQPAPGKSAQTEPVWPTSAGVTVTDNEVIWEGVIATRLVWEASPILKSGATEPAWPDSIGGAVHDGTIDWIAISRRVEDPNCPNSKVVAIMASKVFAADGDIVRFSATVNPLDWTSTQNAGYLPTGLQQANANDMAVLAPYRSNLAAFNASSFQNWQVDPDPAAMALLDQMDGIGSQYQQAAQSVGNDLFYLSQLGVRSVGIAAGTDNLQAGDVGMPIDVLVRESIRIAKANDTPVLATYYPGAGQYWLAVRALQPLAIMGDLPDGAPGDVVSYQYAVSGGVLPRTVSIASGALPAGLSMSATGLVTGTRTTLGSYTWTVRVTDADGATADLVDTSTTADNINTAILADAPLLYWPLNETSGTVANDLSGNGYNGTYTGGTLTGSGFTMTTWTDHVIAATGSAGGSPLDVGTDRDWAIEAVVTRGATQPFDNVSGNIAAQWRSPSLGYASMCLWMPSTGKVATSFTGYFTPSNLSPSVGVSSAAPPVNGARTHVYMERVQGSGATDTLNIYLNGVLSKTASVSSTLVGTASNGAQFCVGYYPGTSYGWLGTVEHVAVYNHALGAARALYHAQLLGLA